MVEFHCLNVPDKQEKILIIGPSWVGDMVMAQSLFMGLKERKPDCLIDVLAPTWSLDLLARMPEVHQFFPMPLKHGEFGLMSRIKTGLNFAAENYQQAYILPNSWKSALIPFIAGIPRRTGYIGEARWGMLNDARRLNKKLAYMTVQRFVNLASSADNLENLTYHSPKLITTQELQSAVIQKFDINLNKRILAICPGAEFGSAKRWPVEYFAEIAREKFNQGWQILLFGSEKDKQIANEINILCNQVCLDFTGKTTLGEAIDLLSLSHTVICNDSGLMHVAAALDKNLIAIYGSSDPTFTPPLLEKAKIIKLDLDCSPCFKRECPYGHKRCLTDILPTTVLHALE